MIKRKEEFFNMRKVIGNSKKVWSTRHVGVKVLFIHYLSPAGTLTPVSELIKLVGDSLNIEWSVVDALTCARNYSTF